MAAVHIGFKNRWTCNFFHTVPHFLKLLYNFAGVFRLSLFGNFSFGTGYLKMRYFKLCYFNDLKHRQHE